MKKNIWFPVCVLVLGILCASCNTSTSPKPDIWLPVTSLDQLDGTWKGVYQQTMPVKEVFALLGETGDDMNNMIVMLGDMKVTMSAETTFTINAQAKTTSGVVTIKLTFSEGTINFTWGIIRLALETYIPDAVFNDKNHSVTMTQDIPEDSITDEEIAKLLASGIQINQDGNKIKIPAGTILDELYGEIPLGIIPPEIIMTKQ